MPRTILVILLAIFLGGCAPVSSSPTPGATLPSANIILQRGDAARTGLYNFPAMRDKPELKWRTQLGSSLYLGTPLLAGDMLYTGGSDGQIYALDAQTGKVLWSAGNFEATETAIAIAGDVIIGGGQNKSVKALNRLTGNVIWSFEAGTFVFAPPVIVDGTVYIATYEKLYALDLKTGKAAWETPLGSQMAFVGTPAVEGDSVYINVGPLLVALDRSSGAERWRVETQQQFFWLALSQGLVYIGNADGYLYAYDQVTGKERWKFKSKFGADEIWSAPAIAGNTVYAGSRDQYVYALDASTGQQKWTFKTEGESLGAPLISDGLLYLSDSDHALPLGVRRLYGLEAATGKPVWTFEINSTLLTTPALGQNVIFITITGEVIALQ
jgi:outer membrane protein assembly factor BamB